MRISDWSSDVCSSDLSCLCAKPFSFLRRRYEERFRTKTQSYEDGEETPVLPFALSLSKGRPCCATRKKEERCFDKLSTNGSGKLRPLAFAAIRSEEHTSELQSLMRI